MEVVILPALTDVSAQHAGYDAPATTSRTTQGTSSTFQHFTPSKITHNTAIQPTHTKPATHPTFRRLYAGLYTAGITITGSVIIIIGIILIPLPGPGSAVILLGLSLLARRFHWAQRLFTYAKNRLQQSCCWLSAQSLWHRIGLYTAGTLAITACTALSLYIFGFPPFAATTAP